MTLTEHLLNLESTTFKNATQHIFLKQVGGLTVEPQNLKAWMYQSRLITESYIKMIGYMIHTLPVYSLRRDGEYSVNPYSEEKAKRIVELLTQALSHVNLKSNLLTEYLSREPYVGQYMNVEELGVATALYRYALEETVVKTGGNDVGEALMTMWLMETVSVRAWDYAKQTYDENSLQAQTIHTKTCKDLTTIGTCAFVDTLATLVNEVDISDPQRMTNMEDLYKKILRKITSVWQLACNSTS